MENSNQMSQLQKAETNDCVVRSIQNAFGIKYEEAHQFCEEQFQRIPRKGVSTAKIEEALLKNQFFGKKTEKLGEEVNGTFGMFTHYENVRTKTEIVCKMSVGTFIEQYPQGTFLILVRKHAFVIKDGEVFGNSDDATKLRRIVLNAYKISDAASKTKKKAA